MADKHMFGMGYPYFICGYDEHVACSTDYGILLFKIGGNKFKDRKVQDAL